MAEGTTEARVFVLAGPDFARSFPLRERSTLGRADECDVVLRDRSISRKHAVLVREGEQWFVQDLGSTNGVSKDGKRGERFELADGDEFKLGDLPLRLRLTAAAAEEIEFESSAPAAAVAPSPARPAEPARAPRAAEPEIEVEEADEIEIEGPDEPVPARGARELPATVFRPPRAARRTGFFSSDLGQQPFWMRCLVALAVLVFGACLAYGAFRAVMMLRAGL